MQLRTRIFLSVGGFFVATMVVVTVVRLWEMKENLYVARKKIETGIEEVNASRRGNVLTFLYNSIIDVETKIYSLFSNMQHAEWLKVKYIPSQLNYETNNWSNSSILILSNDWINFIQTINQGKLTSRIESISPFSTDFKRILVGGEVNVIIQNHYTEECRAYVGVPYWSNELMDKVNKTVYQLNILKDQDENFWLLFTVEQLLAIDASKLHQWSGVEIPVRIGEPVIALHGEKIIKDLVKTTIAFIQDTQTKLQKHPELVEILKSSASTFAWLKKEGIELNWENNNNENFCNSYMCDLFKNTYHKNIKTSEWIERYNQNLLMGQIATITGTGLWNFDPLEELAPKGIVSFPEKDTLSTKWESNQGKGIFSAGVFFDEKVPVVYNCTMEKSADFVDSCISKDLQVYIPNTLNAAYLINTIAFADYIENKNTPTQGTLSVGVDIIPLFKQLALASSYNILFVHSDGTFLYVNKDGEVESINKWSQNTVSQLSSQKEGSIVDINGNGYVFHYITSVVANGGNVYVVELIDSGLKMEEKLNAAASILSHQITIQQIIITIICVVLTLLIQDRIIRKITKPIRTLALGIGKVATRRYEEIEIPIEKKNANDEINVLIHSFTQMIKDLKQGEQVRGILDKVVSKEIAEKIIREGVKLGGEIREVTVLFSDIRGFTHITQNMDPQDVLDMLNDCLTILTKAIDDFEGVIDKYVGDEVMALFGAPVETKHSALSAVQCAKSMREVMREWNRQRKESGKIPLEIGIGIHTGKMIAGNVGAESHPSYTVLGHNVNLASRLCGQAAPMEILITEEVLNAPQVRENIQVEPLPPLTLKGITDPIKAYRVL